jgi:hypothetical protein
MISTRREVSSETVDALSPNDWAAICEMALQHRLAPLLHYQSQTRAAHWVLPPDVRDQWKRAFDRSALRALSTRGVIARLNRILLNADIPYAALKGAWLAQHAYPDPALRPMRDIDILVEPDNARTVFDLLGEHGFKRVHDALMPVDHALKHGKHLPPLQCDATGVSVEIHVRLVDESVNLPTSFHWNNAKNLLKTSEYRNDIPYLPATDMLLHLIVHAVYDHKFNNGPLTFCDVAFLIQNATINWPEFWGRAREAGWERGCNLVLDIAATYHDVENWSLKDTSDRREADMVPSQEISQHAGLLALQNFRRRGAISYQAELATASNLGKRAWLNLKRAFPARHTLAEFAGSRSVKWHTIFHYPFWLLDRGRSMQQKHGGIDLTMEIKHATEVTNWLNGRKG